MLKMTFSSRLLFLTLGHHTVQEMNAVAARTLASALLPAYSRPATGKPRAHHKLHEHASLMQSSQRTYLTTLNSSNATEHSAAHVCMLLLLFMLRTLSTANKAARDRHA